MQSYYSVYVSIVIILLFILQSIKPLPTDWEVRTFNLVTSTISHRIKQFPNLSGNELADAIMSSTNKTGCSFTAFVTSLIAETFTEGFIKTSKRSRSGKGKKIAFTVEEDSYLKGLII